MHRFENCKIAPYFDKYDLKDPIPLNEMNSVEQLRLIEFVCNVSFIKCFYFFLYFHFRKIEFNKIDFAAEMWVELFNEYILVMINICDMMNFLFLSFRWHRILTKMELEHIFD